MALQQDGRLPPWTSDSLTAMAPDGLNHQNPFLQGQMVWTRNPWQGHWKPSPAAWMAFERQLLGPAAQKMRLCQRLLLSWLSRLIECFQLLRQVLVHPWRVPSAEGWPPFPFLLQQGLKLLLVKALKLECCWLSVKMSAWPCPCGKP